MKQETGLITKIAAFISGFLSKVSHTSRAAGLILIIAACVAGFLSIRGTMPFMPVFGTSMEPELHAGSIILIEEASPSEIEVGDIIVFTIPPLVRESYNYPPVIAHRVVEVYTREYGKIFRTKGDNTGEDPFTVRPQDLKGKVSQQIPYLGFPLLFFQSRQGLIFVIIGLSLLALYLYTDELTQGRRKLQKALFAPVIQNNQRHNRMLERRTDTIEKGMESTQRALEKFASAIELYAEHLASHTGAIQGLSEASHELKKGAAEQNKILARLVETMEQPPAKVVHLPHKPEEVVPEEQVAPKLEEVVPEAERIKFPPGCFKAANNRVGKSRYLGLGK